MLADFTQRLLKWNKDQNDRSMPWKFEKDPYRIWLSEVILQQTRVEQGLAYYQRFVQNFPAVSDLAKAPEQKVMKLWEGLGYYARCRNMLATAKIIVSQYGGKFPGTYEQILALKGVGPYSAAAISSFAFGLPMAVVDGNVQRVLARYFGLTTPVNSSAGKKFYADLALACLDSRHPGKYNQAIMDFGAIVCKPKQPLCKGCVQAKHCVACQQGLVGLLPVRKKRIAKKQRWFYYFIVENKEGGIYIRQRKENDIWKNLFEFALFESDQLLSSGHEQLAVMATQLLGAQRYTINEVSAIYKQDLTHQTIYGQFIHMRSRKAMPTLQGYLPIGKRQLNQFPFPRLIVNYLLQLAGKKA